MPTAASEVCSLGYDLPRGHSNLPFDTHYSPVVPLGFPSTLLELGAPLLILKANATFGPKSKVPTQVHGLIPAIHFRSLIMLSVEVCSWRDLQFPSLVFAKTEDKERSSHCDACGSSQTMGF